MLVALTNNVNGQVHQDVPNTGFSEGQTVCNIFFPTDCVVVKNGKLPIYLNYGETKIFVPKTSSLFTESEEHHHHHHHHNDHKEE